LWPKRKRTGFILHTIQRYCFPIQRSNAVSCVVMCLFFISCDMNLVFFPSGANSVGKKS
uniref:Uncharacterized protein n=1 Tax=Aegilops tauschii subsp. strangulata TaxID=200361 RepID=A0A453G1Z3_AEGTS